MRACARKSASRAQPCRQAEAEDLGRADRRDRAAADGRASSERAEFRCAVGTFLAGRGAGLSADQGADLLDELIDRQQWGENLGVRLDVPLRGAGPFPLVEAEVAYRASVHWKAGVQLDAQGHLALNRAAPRRAGMPCWREALELAWGVGAAGVPRKSELEPTRALQPRAPAELQASERRPREAAPERASAQFPEPLHERWRGDEPGRPEQPAQARALA
jgi:hypothetical protein